MMKKGSTKIKTFLLRLYQAESDAQSYYRIDLVPVNGERKSLKFNSLDGLILFLDDRLTASSLTQPDRTN